MSIDQEIKEGVDRKIAVQDELDVIEKRIHVMKRELSRMQGRNHEKDCNLVQQEIDRFRNEQKRLMQELEGLK